MDLGILWTHGEFMESVFWVGQSHSLRTPPPKIRIMVPISNLPNLVRNGAGSGVRRPQETPTGAGPAITHSNICHCDFNSEKFKPVRILLQFLFTILLKSPLKSHTNPFYNRCAGG